MAISKRQVAAAVKRFPLILGVMHSFWRFTRPHFTAGVIGVLFNPLGEVLIVEHVYHSYPQWGLPGGYVDRGEEPQDSLAREFSEELDLKIDVVALITAQRAFGNHLDFAYLCRSNGAVGTLCNELLDYRWVAPANLPELRSFHRYSISQAVVLMESRYDNKS